MPDVYRPQTVDFARMACVCSKGLNMAAAVIRRFCLTVFILTPFPLRVRSLYGCMAAVSQKNTLPGFPARRSRSLHWFSTAICWSVLLTGWPAGGVSCADPGQQSARFVF